MKENKESVVDGSMYYKEILIAGGGSI